MSRGEVLRLRALTLELGSRWLRPTPILWKEPSTAAPFACANSSRRQTAVLLTRSLNPRRRRMKRQEKSKKAPSGKVTVVKLKDLAATKKVKGGRTQQTMAAQNLGLSGLNGIKTR